MDTIKIHASNDREDGMTTMIQNVINLADSDPANCAYHLKIYMDNGAVLVGPVHEFGPDWVSIYLEEEKGMRWINARMIKYVEIAWL